MYGGERMKFSKAQQEAITIRNQNVIVSASAGSGKTSVLVERLCQLVLKDRVEIDRILAMTFTKDAAAEMKDRLRSSLQEANKNDEKDEYILRQLAFLETADICTIDSFCLSVLQNYYYLDKRLTLAMTQNAIDDARKADLMEQAYHDAKAKMDTDELAHMISVFYSLGKKEEDIRTWVTGFNEIANAKPEPSVWIQEVSQGKNNEQLLALFLKRIEHELHVLKTFYEEIQDWHDLYALRLDMINDCLKELEENGYSGYLQAFRHYQANKGKRHPNAKSLREPVDPDAWKAEKKPFDELEKQLIAISFDAEIYDQDAKRNGAILQTFCTLALYTRECYQTLKKEHEVVDFSDMSHYAYDLIANYEIVRQELTDKYQYILIDEFQDTNDLQESIINLIAHKDNVFRVGDIKQAIYGFRQARPAIMKEHLDSDTDTTIVMDQNFRSNQSIIDFNNDFYQKIMNTEKMESQFSDIDIAKVGSADQSKEPQYPVRYLYSESDDMEAGHPQTRQSMANHNRFDIIAHDILKHHQAGTAYRDICILTRTNKTHEEMRDTLEAYGIPAMAEINHGFYTNAAVQIVLMTLKSIIDPYDDIALCASLCSPIGLVKPAQLAACKNNPGSSLYQRIKGQPLMRSWNQLAQQSHSSIEEWLRAIYAHNDFYQSYTSTVDKTNLDALLEQAGQYPNQGEILRFIQDQEKDSEKDKEAEAFPYGKDADVVRIKTMHKSKGLQYPVVYLLGHQKKLGEKKYPLRMDADLGLAMMTVAEDQMSKRISREYLAMTHKESLDAIYEEMRVFYVATTRAQKECIIVDAITNMDQYLSDLTLGDLLKRIDYSDWLLHTYHGLNNPLIRFEQHDYYQRPDIRNQKVHHVSFPTYKGPVSVSETMTASALKQKVDWKPFDLNDETATKRGTLFHEIMASCSYPFQEEDVRQFALANHYEMRPTDIEQILALNHNETYQEWMSQPHDYELSYIVEKEQAVVHGFMDLVVWESDTTIIVDYKTDTVKTAQELADRYRIQLETYKDSMLEIDPDKPVKTYLYSFHLQELISL